MRLAGKTENACQVHVPMMENVPMVQMSFIRLKNGYGLF
jgi:hypothetical protein